MDQQAASLLATLKRPAAPSDAKLNALNELKSGIKHYRVPENAQATIYECIKLAITQQASATLATAAFATLGHLIKRLKIQDPSVVAITQLSPRLYGAILERLGDSREQIRASATTALCEMWPFLAQDVEKIIRDDAIGGANPRAKEAGMQWVVKMHQDEGLPFKSYVGPIVASVEDADGTVRDAAKHALVDLFRDAPDRAKLDLKRQLKAHSVRHAIETQILSQIGAADAAKTHAEPEPELGSSTRSLPRTEHPAHFAKSVNSEAAQPPPQEVVPMDPLYVQSERELSDIFREMTPHFEGKETEQNWIPRDKSVTKIRRLLTGNAPEDHHQAFMAGVKNVLEGVLKVANSLRTTMSTNGCQLVQELAKVLGPAMDHHVEILLQNFMKMSSATKHIAAENGRITTDVVLQHCTYHVRMVQHIWGAAQEKNAQLRGCTPQWLLTVLRRQAPHKTHFETSGGLELAEKCIRKGLDDANPKVKEATRATYWTFAKTWPDKAEFIINKLDPKSRSMLEKDSNNPNAAIFQSQSSSGGISRATTPHGRTALKEMMEEQRRAKSAARGGSDRPSSAMATTTPARSRGDMSSANRAPSRLRGEARVPSNTSTTSTTGTSKGDYYDLKHLRPMVAVRRREQGSLRYPHLVRHEIGQGQLQVETPVQWLYVK
ncbi:hypothetical protein AMS68_006148 [Peltaster fructicola]|uniref:TOG domain-containing protein n=1 Tax=Peltaster fructicola TaxID=286661 RepID=A0A6H0Y132_9PEZI|nr:hypothetical protein AMS68_006148 [Peltaster fructicola]